VKLALPVRGRRLPMRFITPPANGFAICPITPDKLMA
jgi:hypothetical protein